MADMGISTAIALAGLAASAGGTAYAAKASSDAAGAQQRSNDQAISAQNEGFWQRNAAARTQLEAQAAAQATAQSAQDSANQEMRTRQGQALDTRDAAVAAENQQAEALRAQADAARVRLLAGTNAQAMDAAQAAAVAQRTALVEPVADSIQETSALGTPGEGATQQAYAVRLNEAANRVRDYGRRVAAVNSYTAPISAVGQAVSEDRTALMPLTAANRLLHSGANARILPSQTAYDIAGSQGAARKESIASALRGDLNVANNQYEGGKTVADLQQGNTTQLARNAAITAGAEAEQARALGQLIATGGNIAAYGGTRYGDTINGYGDDIGAWLGLKKPPISPTFPG